MSFVIVNIQLITSKITKRLLIVIIWTGDIATCAQSSAFVIGIIGQYVPVANSHPCFLPPPQALYSKLFNVVGENSTFLSLSLPSLDAAPCNPWQGWTSRLKGAPNHRLGCDYPRRRGGGVSQPAKHKKLTTPSLSVKQYGFLPLAGWL